MTPFLLIPGLNANARVYRDAAEALWPFGQVTVANHLQGEGVADIANRILSDAPPRFALAGFSFGGYLTFEIIRQAPERVAKLALIDTSARQDTQDAIEMRRRRIEMAKAGKFSLVVQQSFPGSVHPDHVEDQTLLEIHRTMSMTNGPEAYVRHQESIISRPDSRGDLQGISVPTVIIVGEADAITPVDAAREMEANIPDSHLVIVRGAGHLALLEEPTAVANALVDWARR